MRSTIFIFKIECGLCGCLCHFCPNITDWGSCSSEVNFMFQYLFQTVDGVPKCVHLSRPFQVTIAESQPLSLSKFNGCCMYTLFLIIFSFAVVRNFKQVISNKLEDLSWFPTFHKTTFSDYVILFLASWLKVDMMSKTVIGLSTGKRLFG